VFSDGSLTRVSVENSVSESSVMDMAHELLRFVFGQLKGSQIHWATVDKKACSILSVCRRLT